MREGFIRAQAQYKARLQEKEYARVSKNFRYETSWMKLEVIAEKTVLLQCTCTEDSAAHTD
jgi:hypothetical protein